MSLWDRTPDPRTHSSTLPGQQGSPMPQMAAGGKDDGQAVGLLLKPGEDSGLHPGERASYLDSMTKKI